MGDSSDNQGNDPALRDLQQELPGLTEDDDKSVGSLKNSPEDFRVDELPAYEPTGQGDHLFLWIEKRAVSSEQLIGHLARVLQLPRGDVGMAGMKDRQAVTRQYVSVPADVAGRLEALDTHAVRVFTATRHPHKLRTGHLRGNRFSILARGVDPGAVERIKTIGERIQKSGFPNYYGEQRFGHELSTLVTGLNLLRGTKRPFELPRARRKFLLRLALSAVQAAVFNQVLAARVRDGLVHRVMLGDVMQPRGSQACFLVDDAEVEQHRFDQRETVISGPLFGPKMKSSFGEVARREARILQELQLEQSHFQRFKRITRGTRRAYLVWPADLQIELEANGLRFDFCLPSGSYATTFMREFIKATPQPTP